MKNLQTRVYTDLASEPVTSEEAKNFCKVTGTQDDALFAILISAARQSLEKYTNSSFVEKTIHATWIKPPDNMEFELPYGPHIAVSKVYRIDSEGTETALTVNTDYWIYGDQDFVLYVNQYWSTSGVVTENSYRIEYTAGYGKSGTTELLPDALMLAILKEVATQYDIRENITSESVNELSNAARRLADPYRRKLWF